MKRHYLICVAVLVVVATAYAQTQLGTAFTYQGHLLVAGEPAQGTYNMLFRLYASADGEPPLALYPSDGTPLPVPVNAGLFAVSVEFDAVFFDGDARWLAIQVEGTPLTPRQLLAPTPYALALAGLRTEQNATSPNVVGGWKGNSVGDGAVGATIGGGGAGDADRIDQSNKIYDNYGTIGGGQSNTAGLNDGWPAAQSHATVGGGYQNDAAAMYATVGGGWDNDVTMYGGTIGGGVANEVSPSTAGYGTIAGGYQNYVTAEAGAIGGGRDNHVGGQYAAIPGGISNYANGNYSFAAGRMARAYNAGSFVWADSTGAVFGSTAADQFLVRAAGGVGINKNSPAAGTLDVAGNGLFSGRVGIGTTGPGTRLELDGSSGDDAVLYLRAFWNPEIYFDMGGVTADAKLHFTVSTTERWQILYDGSEDRMKFLKTGAANPVMSMDGFTQRVGIGMADPTEKLDVDGTARLRGISSGGISTAAVLVDGNGKLWKQTSSLRYKHNVTDMVPTGEAVLALRPVSFAWDSTGEADVGLIAEEVVEVLPDLVFCDAEGRPEGVKYDKLALYLLGVVRQQRDTMAALQCEKDAEIAALGERLEKLETLVQELAAAKEGGGR